MYPLHACKLSFPGRTQQNYVLDWPAFNEGSGPRSQHVGSMSLVLAAAPSAEVFPYSGGLHDFQASEAKHACSETL